MGMIFESILLDKVYEEVDVEKKKIQWDENDEQYKKELQIISSKVTFGWFKVSLIFNFRKTVLMLGNLKI